MRYGSVCSGIEAATVAWHTLGWEPQWFSEIEAFPSAVLAHHYPRVPNLGDMTKIQDSEVFNGSTIDLLVGGTPCQSFSVAGLRKGLADPRGNLALHFLKLIDAARPRWVVWENVPGVLSSNGGRDFGAFLGGLAELGYGWAYRVLDAQYFGVAQRRRRVFVVGYLGDWRRAAAVLFERDSLSGNPAPSRGEREGSPRGFEIGPQAGRFVDLAPTLDARCKDGPIRNQLGAGVYHGMPALARCDTTGEGRRQDYETTTLIAFDPTQITSPENGSNPQPGSPWHTLAKAARAPVIAFNARQGPTHSESVFDSLGTKDTGHGLAMPQGVRRLTPRECERLQGFPDDYTLTPYRGKGAADGPRYKALGNSMAVPVMRWIGERIQEVERLTPPTTPLA